MKLNTSNFPSNTSDNIKDIYFNIYKITNSIINVTYFNDKYLTYFRFNPNINDNNIKYYTYSLGYLEHTKLVLFLIPENNTIQNNTINIVKLNFTNEKKNIKIKTYNVSIYTSRVNCIPINNDNIVCEFIEYRIYSEKYGNPIYNKQHYLVLLQNETDISKEAIKILDKKCK